MRICGRARPRNSSFTIFVDRIFTVLRGQPFTTLFAASAESRAFACLCRARNAD